MDRTFSELVTQHLQPVILVTTSPSVEASSLKCGLTFTEHLHPFFQRSEATQPVTIRNLAGRDRIYKSLAYRLVHSSEFQALKVQQMNQYIKFRLGNMVSIQHKADTHGTVKGKYNPNHPNGDQSLNNNTAQSQQPNQTNHTPVISSGIATPSFLQRLQHRAEHLFLAPFSSNPNQTAYLFGFTNTTLHDPSNRFHHSHHSLQNVHNSLYTTSVHSSAPIVFSVDNPLNLTHHIDNFTTSNSDPTTLPQSHIIFTAFQSTRRSIRTFFTRMPDPTPWYNRLRQIITELSHFSSSHLLDQPIAQILAISASEPQPLHTLQQLSYHHNTPTAVREVLSTNGEKTSAMSADILASFCQQNHENYQRPIQYGVHPLHRIYAVVVDHDITHGLNVFELVLIYLRFYRNPSQMRKLKELWNTAVFTHDFIATELLSDVPWIRDYLFIRENGIWGSSSTSAPKTPPQQPQQQQQQLTQSQSQSNHSVPSLAHSNSNLLGSGPQSDPLRQLEGELAIEDEAYYFNRQFKRAQRHQQRQQQQQQQQTTQQAIPQQQQGPTGQYNANDVLKSLPSVLKVESAFPLFSYLLNQWTQAQQLNQQPQQQHHHSNDQPVPGSIQHGLAVAAISDSIKWSTQTWVQGVEIVVHRMVRNPFLATIDEIFTTQAIIINNTLIPTILPNYIWIGCCTWLTSLEFQRCVLAVDLYNDISTSLRNTALTLSAIDATLHSTPGEKNSSTHHTGKDHTSVSTTISSNNHELVTMTSARRFELNISSSMIHIFPYFNNTTYLNCLSNIIGSIETLGIVADVIGVSPSNSGIQGQYLVPTLHNSQFTSADSIKHIQKFHSATFISHLNTEQSLKSPPISSNPSSPKQIAHTIPGKQQNYSLLLPRPFHARNIGSTRGRFDFNRRRHEILKRTLKILILSHQTTYLNSTNHPAAQLLQQARVTTSSFRNNSKTEPTSGGLPRAMSTSHLSSQRHKDLVNGYQANYQQTNVVMNLNRNNGLHDTLGTLYESSIHDLKTIGFLAPQHEMLTLQQQQQQGAVAATPGTHNVGVGGLHGTDLSALLTPFDPNQLLAQRWADETALETNTNQTSYLFPPTIGLLSIQQQKRATSFLASVQDAYTSSHPFFNLDQFLAIKITVPNHHLSNNIFHPAQNANSPTLQQQTQEKSFFKIPIRPYHISPSRSSYHPPEPHPATQITSFYAIPLDDSLRSSITGILQQWTSDSPVSPASSTASITTTTSGSSLRSTLITPQNHHSHASGPVISRLTSLSVINPLTFAKELGLKSLSPTELHSLDSRARKHFGHRSAFTRIGKLPRLPAPQPKSSSDWFSPAFPLNPSMTHFPFLQPAYTRHLSRGMHTNLLVEKPLLTVPIPTSLLTHFGVGPYHSVLVELDSVGQDMSEYNTTSTSPTPETNQSNNTLDNLGDDDLYDEYDDEEDEDDDDAWVASDSVTTINRSNPMFQQDPSPSFFASSPPILMKGFDGYHPPYYFQHNELSMCALQGQASKIMQSLATHLEHLIHSTNTKTSVKKSFKSSIRGLFSFSGSSGSSNAHEQQQNQLFYNNSLKRLYNVIIDLCGCPQCGNQSLNHLHAVQNLNSCDSSLTPTPSSLKSIPVLPTAGQFGLNDALVTIKYVISPQLRLAVLMMLTQEFSSAIQYLKATLASDGIKSPHLVAYINYLLAICYSLYDTQPDGSLSVNNAITQLNLALTPMLVQLPYRLAYPKQDSLFFTIARLWTQSSSSSLQPFLETLGKISHAHLHPPDHSTSFAPISSQFGPSNANFNASSSSSSIVIGETTYVLDPSTGASGTTSTPFSIRTASQLPTGPGFLNGLNRSTQAILDTPNRATAQDSSMLPLSMQSMQLLLAPNASTNQLLHILGPYVPAPQSDIYGEQKAPVYTVPNTGIAASSLASLFNNITIGGGHGQQYDLQSIATLFHVSDIASLINQPISDASYLLEGWALENFFYLTDLHRMPSTYKTPTQSPAESKLLFSAKATGSATSDQYQSLIQRKELTLPLLQKFSQCTCHVHDLQLFGHFVKNQVHLLEKFHESLSSPSRKAPAAPSIVSAPVPGVHSMNVTSFLDTFRFNDIDQKSFSTFTGSNVIFAASELLKISQTTQLSAITVSQQMARNVETMALNGTVYPPPPTKKDDKNPEPTNPSLSAPLQNPTLCLSPFILEQMAYAHLYNPKAGSPVDDLDDNEAMMMSSASGSNRATLSSGENGDTNQKSYITRRSRYIAMSMNDSEHQNHIEQFGQMILIAAKSYLVHGYYLYSIRCVLCFTKLTPLMQKSSTCMIVLDLLTTALDWYSSQLLYSHQYPLTLLDPNHTTAPQSRPFAPGSVPIIPTQSVNASSQVQAHHQQLPPALSSDQDKLKTNWWLHDTRDRAEELAFITHLRQYAAQLSAISITHHFTNGALHTAQQFSSLLFHTHFYKNNNSRLLAPPRPRSSSSSGAWQNPLPPMTFRVPNSFIPLVPSHSVDLSALLPASTATPKPDQNLAQRASCIHNGAEATQRGENKGHLGHLFDEFYKKRNFMQYSDHINSSLVIVDACDHCYQLAANSAFGQSGYLLHGGNYYGLYNTNSFIPNATREILDTTLKTNLQSTIPPHLLPNYHKKLGLSTANNSAISLKNLNRQGTQSNLNIDPSHYNPLILQQQQLQTLLTFEAFQSLYRICMLWNINSYLADSSVSQYYNDNNSSAKGLHSSLSSTSFSGIANPSMSNIAPALRYGLHSSQSELDESTMTSFMSGQSSIYNTNSFASLAGMTSFQNISNNYQSTMYDASTSHNGSVSGNQSARPSLQSLFSFGDSNPVSTTTLPTPTLATIPSPVLGSKAWEPNTDWGTGSDNNWSISSPSATTTTTTDPSLSTIQDPSIPTINLPKLLPQEEVEYMQIPFPMYTILGTRLGLPHTQTTFVNHAANIHNNNNNHNNSTTKSSNNTPSSQRQPSPCALCCSGACFKTPKTPSPALQRRPYNPTSFSNTIQYVPLHLHGQSLALGPVATQHDILVNDQVSFITSNNSHLSFVSNVFKASLQSRGNVSGLTDKSSKVYNILTEGIAPKNEKFYHQANINELATDLSTFTQSNSSTYYVENVNNMGNSPVGKSNANAVAGNSNPQLQIPHDITGYSDFGLPDGTPPHHCSCQCRNPDVHDRLGDEFKTNLAGKFRDNGEGNSGNGQFDNSFKAFSHNEAQFSVPLYEPITVYIALYNPLPVMITCSDVSLGLSLDILHDKPDQQQQTKVQNVSSSSSSSSSSPSPHPFISTSKSSASIPTIDPDDPYRINDLSQYQRQFEVTSSQGQVVIRPYDTHIVELTVKLTLSGLNNSKGVLPQSVVQNVSTNGDFLQTLPAGSIFLNTPEPTKRNDLMGMFMYDESNDDESFPSSPLSVTARPTPPPLKNKPPMIGHNNNAITSNTVSATDLSLSTNNTTDLLLPYSFDTFFLPIISAKFSHFTATVNKIPTIFPITPAAFDWLQYIATKRHLVTYLKREQSKIQNQMDANALLQLPSRSSGVGTAAGTSTSAPSSPPVVLSSTLNSYNLSAPSTHSHSQSSLLTNISNNMAGNGKVGTRMISILPNLSTFLPTQYSFFKNFSKLIQNFFPINASRYTLTSNNTSSPFYVNYIADITTLPTMFQNTMSGAGFFGYLALFLNNQLYQIHLQRFKSENNSLYGMNRYDTPPSMHSSLVQFDHTDTKFQINFNNYKSAKQAQAAKIQSQQQKEQQQHLNQLASSSDHIDSSEHDDHEPSTIYNTIPGLSKHVSPPNPQNQGLHGTAGKTTPMDNSLQHSTPGGASDTRSGYDRYLDAFLQDDHNAFSGYTTYVNNSQLLSMQFALQTLPELNDSENDNHTLGRGVHKNPFQALALTNQRNYVYSLFHNYSSLYDSHLAVASTNPSRVDFFHSPICVSPPPPHKLPPIISSPAPVSSLVSSLNQSAEMRTLLPNVPKHHDYDLTIVNGFSDVISKDMGAIFSPSSPGVPMTQFQSLHEVSSLLFGPQSRKIILPSFFHPFYKPLTANPLLYGHCTEYLDPATTNPHHINLFINNYTTPTQSSMTTALKPNISVKQTTHGIRTETSEGGISYTPTPFANNGNKSVGVFNHPDRRSLVSSLTTPKSGPINASRGSITSRTSIDLMGMGLISGETDSFPRQMSSMGKLSQASHEETISLTLFQDDDYKMPPKPHTSSENDTKQLLFDTQSSSATSAGAVVAAASGALGNNIHAGNNNNNNNNNNTKKQSLIPFQPQIIPAFAKTLNILDAMGSLECLQDAEHSVNSLDNVKQHYKLPPYLDPISLQFVNNQSYAILVNSGYAPIYNITFDSTHSHMLSLYITDRESASGSIGVGRSSQGNGSDDEKDYEDEKENSNQRCDFTQSGDYLDLDDITNLKSMVLLPGQSIRIRLLFRTVQTGLFDIQCSFAYNTMTRSQFLVSLQAFPDDLIKHTLETTLPDTKTNHFIQSTLTSATSLAPETKFSALVASPQLQARYITYFLQKVISPQPVINVNKGTIKSSPTSLARTLRVGQVINVLPSILVHTVDFRQSAAVDETSPCVWCAKKQISYETVADWMYRFGWVTQAQSVASYASFIAGTLKGHTAAAAAVGSAAPAITTPQNSSSLLHQTDSIPQAAAILENGPDDNDDDDDQLDLDAIFGQSSGTASKRPAKTIKSLFAKAAAASNNNNNTSNGSSGVAKPHTNGLFLPTTRAPSFLLSGSDIPQPSSLISQSDINTNNNLSHQPSPISLEDYQSFIVHLNSLLQSAHETEHPETSSPTLSPDFLHSAEKSKEQPPPCPQICSCSPFGALMTIFDVRQNPLHTFSTEGLSQSSSMLPSPNTPGAPSLAHNPSLTPNLLASNRSAGTGTGAGNTGGTGLNPPPFQPNNLDSLLLNLYSSEINISTILLSSLMFSADQCHLSSIVTRDAYGTIVKSTLPNFVTLNLNPNHGQKSKLSQQQDSEPSTPPQQDTLTAIFKPSSQSQSSLFSIPMGGSISFVVQLRAKNPSNFVMQSSLPLLSSRPGPVGLKSGHGSKSRNGPVSSPLTAAMPHYAQFDAPWLQTILSRGLIPRHDLFKFCPSSALMNDLGLTTTAKEWDAKSNSSTSPSSPSPSSPEITSPTAHGLSSASLSPFASHCSHCGGVLSITQRLERLKTANRACSLSASNALLASSPLSTAPLIPSLLPNPSFGSSSNPSPNNDSMGSSNLLPDCTCWQFHPDHLSTINLPLSLPSPHQSDSPGNDDSILPFISLSRNSSTGSSLGGTTPGSGASFTPQPPPPPHQLAFVSSHLLAPTAAPTSLQNQQYRTIIAEDQSVSLYHKQVEMINPTRRFYNYHYYQHHPNHHIFTLRFTLAPPIYNPSTSSGPNPVQQYQLGWKEQQDINKLDIITISSQQQNDSYNANDTSHHELPASVSFSSAYTTATAPSGANYNTLFHGTSQPSAGYSAQALQEQITALIQHQHHQQQVALIQRNHSMIGYVRTTTATPTTLSYPLTMLPSLLEDFSLPTTYSSLLQLFKNSVRSNGNVNDINQLFKLSPITSSTHSVMKQFYALSIPMAAIGGSPSQQLSRSVFSSVPVYLTDDIVSSNSNLKENPISLSSKLDYHNSDLIQSHLANGSSQSELLTRRISVTIFWNILHSFLPVFSHLFQSNPISINFPLSPLYRVTPPTLLVNRNQLKAPSYHTYPASLFFSQYFRSHTISKQPLNPALSIPLRQHNTILVEFASYFNIQEIALQPATKNNSFSPLGSTAPSISPFNFFVISPTPRGLAKLYSYGGQRAKIPIMYISTQRYVNWGPSTSLPLLYFTPFLKTPSLFHFHNSTSLHPPGQTLCTCVNCMYYQQYRQDGAAPASTTTPIGCHVKLLSTHITGSTQWAITTTNPNPRQALPPLQPTQLEQYLEYFSFVAQSGGYNTKHCYLQMDQNERTEISRLIVTVSLPVQMEFRSSVGIPFDPAALP